MKVKVSCWDVLGNTARFASVSHHSIDRYIHSVVTSTYRREESNENDGTKETSE